MKKTHSFISVKHMNYFNRFTFFYQFYIYCLHSNTYKSAVFHFPQLIVIYSKKSPFILILFVCEEMLNIIGILMPLQRQLFQKLVIKNLLEQLSKYHTSCHCVIKTNIKKIILKVNYIPKSIRNRIFTNRENQIRYKSDFFFVSSLYLRKTFMKTLVNIFLS